MTDGTFQTLAVVGAGNMGSGIAQKMATEGFDVVLVDVDDEKCARGVRGIEQTLNEGVERSSSRPSRSRPFARASAARRRSTTLHDAELVVEAVFEESRVKQDVFTRLERVCRRDAILATNTSSFAVTRHRVGDARRPIACIGLHYFYHPAKNRLVEVVAGRATSADVAPARMVAAGAARQDAHRVAATPAASSSIASSSPWLDEAMRMLDEGVADIPPIEAAAKQAFGIGMGPFELMNVTGVPIALHADDRSAPRSGRCYGPPDRSAAAVRVRAAVGSLGRARSRDSSTPSPIACARHRVLHRDGARGRRRRHDRGHRHRRARRPALAARAVRADEPLRARACARRWSNDVAARWTRARSGIVLAPGRRADSRSRSRSCAARRATASPRSRSTVRTR